MVAMLLAAAVAVGLCLDDPRGGSEPDRIGSIITQGNKWTDDNRILDLLHESDMYPAWPMPNEAELLWVEIRLLVRFHDQFNWPAGKRPTLKLLPREGDSPFRDIEVSFPEMSPKRAR